MHNLPSALSTDYCVCQVCFGCDAQFMRYLYKLARDIFKSDPIGDWLAELVLRRLR